MDVNKIDIGAYQRMGNISDENIKLIDECKTCKLSDKTAEETLKENGMVSVEIIEDDAAMYGPGDKYTYKNGKVYQEPIEIDGVKGTEYSKLLACKDADGKESTYRVITRQFDDGRIEKVMFQLDDSVKFTKDGKAVEMPRKTVEETNTVVQAGKEEATLGGTKVEVAEKVLENKTGTEWKQTDPPKDWDSKGYTAVKDENGNITCYVKDIKDEEGHVGKQYVKFLQTTDEKGKVITAMVDNHQYSERSSVREITILDAAEPKPPEKPPVTPSRPSGGGGGGGGGTVTPPKPDCPDVPVNTDPSGVGDGGENSTGGTETVPSDTTADPENPTGAEGEQGTDETIPTPPEAGEGTTVAPNPTNGSETPAEVPDDGEEVQNEEPGAVVDDNPPCEENPDVNTDDSSSIKKPEEQ